MNCLVLLIVLECWLSQSKQRQLVIWKRSEGKSTLLFHKTESHLTCVVFSIKTLILTKINLITGIGGVVV